MQHIFGCFLFAKFYEEIKLWTLWAQKQSIVEWCIYMTDIFTNVPLGGNDLHNEQKYSKFQLGLVDLLFYITFTCDQSQETTK